MRVNKIVIIITLSSFSLIAFDAIGQKTKEVIFKDLNQNPIDPKKNEKPEPVTIDFPAFIAFLNKDGKKALSIGFLCDVANELKNEGNLQMTFKFDQQDKDLIMKEFSSSELFVWEKLYLDFKNGFVASEGRKYSKPIAIDNHRNRSEGITNFSGNDSLYVENKVREEFDKKVPSNLKIPITFYKKEPIIWN